MLGCCCCVVFHFSPLHKIHILPIIFQFQIVNFISKDNKYQNLPLCVNSLSFGRSSSLRRCIAISRRRVQPFFLCTTLCLCWPVMITATYDWRLCSENAEATTKQRLQYKQVTSVINENLCCLSTKCVTRSLLILNYIVAVVFNLTFIRKASFVIVYQTNLLSNFYYTLYSVLVWCMLVHSQNIIFCQKPMHYALIYADRLCMADPRHSLVRHSTNSLREFHCLDLFNT